MRSVHEFEGIFIHKESVDMRKQINGLCTIVETEMGKDLMGRNLFIFSGRRKHTLKILYFDKSGFCLWQKRLEREKFKWPKLSTEGIVEISSQQLEWLLEGYDVWKMRPFTELHFERMS